MAYYTAGIVGPYVRNALAPSTFDISGGNISNSGTTQSANAIISGRIQTPGTLDISDGNIFVTGSITAGSIASSAIEPTNIVVPGYIRNSLIPSTLDMSGGNISNSGTTASANALVSGYIRNNLAATQFDISGGNILNTGTHTSSNFIGTSSASNTIGGIVLNNGTLRAEASDTFMVAVGQGDTDTIATSTDGITWTGRGQPVWTTTAYGVAWNGSLWVAVGDTPYAIGYSSNGINWTGVFTTAMPVGRGVAWNGSLWVVVGENGKIAYSSNGIDWTDTNTTVFTAGGGLGVAWNGSLWVAVGTGSSHAIATSTDGITWTGRGKTILSTAYGVAWNGTRWVAVGEGNNTIAYSSDGITWTGAGFTVFDIRGLGVAWNGTRWVAVGDGSVNQLAYSSDGITWTGGGIVFSGGTAAGGVAWNGSLWVAVSAGSIHTFATSTDGITWTGRGNSPLSSLGAGVAGRRYVLPLIAPLTLDSSGGNIRFTGSIVGSNSAASNNIGGVTLANTNISNAGTTTSTNALVSGYIRNALIPTQFDISGGNISNSGRITTGPGTVAAPSYTFGADVSMGLYDPATNVLGFVTSGAERMRIAAGGNVGIGTRDPANTLDISSSLDPMITLRNRGGNATLRILGGAVTQDTCGMQIYHGSTEQGIFNSNVLPFHIQTNAVRRLTILSNGNVGIGTTAPVTRLQVNPKVLDDQSYVYDSSAMMVVQPKGTGSTVLNDPTAVLYLARQGTSAQSFGAMATFKLSRFESNDTNSRTRLDFDLTHGFFNDVNVMTMRSDGRVGIGTNAPVYALDVSSTNGTNIALRNSAAGQSSMVVIGGGAADAAGLQVYQSATGQGLYQSNTLPLSLWTKGVQRVTIDQSGNMGINKTAPTNALDVVGSIQTNTQLRFDSPDADKIYLTNCNASGSRITHSAGWSVDILPGPNIGVGGQLRVFRGGATGPLETARFDANGRLGIGTTTATSILDLRGEAATLRVCDTSSLRQPTIELNRNAGGVFGASAIADWRMQVSSSGGNYQLVRGNTTNTLIPFHVDGVYGNVGIGNVNPLTRFHVSAPSNDPTYGIACIENLATFSFPLGLDIGSTMTFRSVWVSDSTNAVTMGAIGVLKESGANYGDSYMAFSTRYESNRLGGAGLLRERMRLSGLGYLGIGTSNPAYTLDVSGTMAANSNEYTMYVTASTASLTVPTGFTMARVTLVGAGGGGGAWISPFTGGGGGGGAGWVVEQLITTLPATFNVSIGGGGLAGTTAGVVPTAGSESTISFTGGTTLRASGGLPSVNVSGTAGTAGGAGYFGGGGGGGGSNGGAGGAGGSGTIQSGTAGVAAVTTTGGAGGLGGGALNAGSSGGGTSGGGGGGGGPAGGAGGTVANSGLGGAGGPGCGGGGGRQNNGGAGGAGYAIIRFLR